MLWLLFYTEAESSSFRNNCKESANYLRLQLHLLGKCFVEVKRMFNVQTKHKLYTRSQKKERKNNNILKTKNYKITPKINNSRKLCKTNKYLSNKAKKYCLSSRCDSFTRSNEWASFIVVHCCLFNFILIYPNNISMTFRIIRQRIGKSVVNNQAYCFHFGNLLLLFSFYSSFFSFSKG